MKKAKPIPELVKKTAVMGSVLATAILVASCSQDAAEPSMTSEPEMSSMDMGAPETSIPEMSTNIDSLMQARPEADKARDDARKPLETMELLGVQKGWTVVDVAAGGGYFTRVISALVGADGTVLAQFGERALQNNDGQMQKELAAELGNIEPVFTGMEGIGDGVADGAITALNLHDAYNFRGEEGGQAFVNEIFRVLKSGGHAVIIDHEGDEGAANQDLHRLPASTARMLIENAGFEVVELSDLLNNPSDDHSLNVRDPSLERATDQFLFVVRKP